MSTIIPTDTSVSIGSSASSSSGSNSPEPNPLKAPLLIDVEEPKELPAPSRFNTISQITNHPAARATATLISTIGIVQALISGNWTELVIWSACWGFFTQATCDLLDGSENPTLRKIHTYGSAIKRHTAMETWLIAGGIQGYSWGAQPASIVNLIMAGSWTKNQIDRWRKEKAPKTTPVQVVATKTDSFIKRNKGTIFLAIIGTTSLAIGAATMNTEKRTLSWKPIIAEYGLKILSAIFGRALESHLYTKRTQSKPWKWAHRIINLQGPLAAAAIHAHTIAPTPATALLTMIPFGIALGSNYSSQRRKFNATDRTIITEAPRPRSTLEKLLALGFTAGPLALSAYYIRTSIGITNWKMSDADGAGEMIAAVTFYHLSRASEARPSDSKIMQLLKRNPRFLLHDFTMFFSNEWLYWRSIAGSMFSKLPATQQLGLEVSIITMIGMVYGTYRRNLNSGKIETKNQKHAFDSSMLSHTVGEIVNH